MARRLRDSFRWGGIALTCLVIGSVALEAAPFGPLARHMAGHLLLMSIVAPLAALTFLAVAPGGTGVVACGRPAALAIATASQIILLWAWHTPVVFANAVPGTGTHVLMQLSLSAAALWFWLEVLSDHGAFRWRALFGLLITGKLFCLLGVLLVFAPRAVYAGRTAAHGHAAALATSTLDDQHLAGLLMVIACPLTYVLAAVIIAARWLRDLSHGPEQLGAPASPSSIQP